MTAHALLSPSAAARWMQCPAAPHREKDLPDTAGPAARMGTNAHAYLEAALMFGALPPVASFQWPHPEHPPTEEMLGGVAACFAYVQRQVQALNEAGLHAYHVPERPVYLEPMASKDLIWGTADVIIMAEGQVYEIIDLKTGGHRVEPDSPQLMIYGLAALLSTGNIKQRESVRLTIFQPARQESGSPARSTMFTPDELLQWWYATMQPAIEAAANPDAPARPSEEACRWCKAASTCKERAEAMFDAVQAVADKTAAPEAVAGDALLSSQPVGEMTPEELGRFLDIAPILEARIKEARDRARELIEQRATVPGWKLVRGRRTRKWAFEDPEVMAKKLRNRGLKKAQIFEEKLRSPAAIQRLGLDVAVWEKVSKLVVEAEGKPVLVPATDRRPSITEPPDFQPVTEEDQTNG